MNALTPHARPGPARAAGAPVLGALSDIFLRLGEHYNTNSNQIVVVAGALDIARLTRAVHAAVADFPLLLQRLGNALPAWQPADFPVREVAFDGACDFAELRFRARLMALSDGARIDWRTRPPTQVFLVRGADAARCCVYLNSAHAAADAKSDCMLLRSIMRHYAHDGQAPPPASAHAFAPLREFMPGWYRPLGRMGRLVRAMLDVAGDNLRRDRAMPLPGSGRFGYAPRNAEADFCSTILPDALMASIGASARRHGVSINTFFCAALVRMLQQDGLAQAGMLRFSCVFSLRGLSTPARQQAFGNHVLTCAVRQAAGRDAVTLLRELHASIQRVRQRRLQVELGRLELALPLMRLRPLQPITRRMMGRAQLTNVCYSNPGVIEEDFSCFGHPDHPVLQYTGLGCLVSPYDLMLYTTTVGGRTQLDALFRKSCFADPEAQLMAPLKAHIGELLAELADAAPAIVRAAGSPA